MANANSAMGPVQKEIYTLLTGDATLTGLLATYNSAPAVFDEVPAAGYSDFPYIQLGEINETPSNTFGRVGRDVRQTIDIYSQAKGWKEAQDILEQLCRLIDLTLLPNPTGWTTQLSEYVFGREIRDPDGTRHIVAQFRINVTQ